MTIHNNRIVALGVAGAIALGFAVSAGPVFAAPVPLSAAALKQVDVNNVVDVQWRRRGNPGPWVAGAALGIIGGVIASQAYQNGYYDNGYGYGPYQNSYYDNSYGYAPYPYGAPYAGRGYYGGYAPYRGYGTCNKVEMC